MEAALFREVEAEAEAVMKKLMEAEAEAVKKINGSGSLSCKSVVTRVAEAPGSGTF